VIRSVSKPILNKLAVYLEQHKNMRLGVEGHTDSMGGMAYNLKLSGRRANAVKSYLVNIGVTAGRLKPSGFGYTKPVADNSTAMGRQLNRRVVFRKL
jgi:OOP family OmpA-OmpF porin